MVDLQHALIEHKMIPEVKGEEQKHIGTRTLVQLSSKLLLPLYHILVQEFFLCFTARIPDGFSSRGSFPPILLVVVDEASRLYAMCHVHKNRSYLGV
jgi:hypothetical protein